MSSTPQDARRHSIHGVCPMLFLLLLVLVVVPRPASAQFLKRIRDAAVQKAAERARDAAGSLADSASAKSGQVSIVLPLRFAPNSDSLAQDQAPVLDALAVAISRLAGNYRLDVFVTDWSEPQAALLHSARRADAVLVALVSRGVSPARLSAVGRGIGLLTRVELNPTL